MVRSWTVFLLLLPAVVHAQEPRTQSRLLYSFETAGEAARLAKTADGAVLETVQDVGVTHGERCVRLTVAKGTAYGTVRLDPEATKNWADFDYLAIDVTTSETEPVRLVVELWDAASKNYATRCTFEDVRTRPGRQTLLYPIGRARRNGKEGRTWEELEPQDKIDRNGLTQVKIFLSPPKDRDAVLFLDNLRLLQEDAAKPRFEVPLPPDSLAWKFGSPGVRMAGFTTLSPGNFAPGEVTAAGEGWPDLMSGTFLLPAEGKTWSASLRIPDGKYRYQLIAGPVYSLNRLPQFRLILGDQKILDVAPTVAEYHSKQHLHRFHDTLFSQRRHALWLDYIDRMYPTHTGSVTIAGGKSTLEVRDCFLSSLVLTPEKHATEFQVFEETVRMRRQQAFERDLRPEQLRIPNVPPGTPYVAHLPAHDTTVTPAFLPTAEERKQPLRHDVQAAPGQRVTVRAVIHPLGNFGPWTAALTGERFPQVEAQTYLQNYRNDGESIREAALLPGRRFALEPGIPWCWWLTFVVPAGTPPGKYEAEWTFSADTVPPVRVPITLEVLPIQLVETLPLSLGMYYSPPSGAGWDAATRKRVWLEQLRFLRGLGFTATSVGSGSVTSVNADGTVRVNFDPTAWELARTAGLGVHPAQYQMGNTLPLGRAIGRRLPGSLGAKVDQNPGIELKQPRFGDYFGNALQQYRDFILQQKLPVAVEVVDEPREFPNPWNRNLADTLAYAEMVRKAGLIGFVTPMGDSNNGKDYSVLADAVDIVSVHAWKASEKLMARAQQQKRTLWFYNTGMDRLSWGFYAWRAGATGRWEWHFYFPEDQARGGYPGREPHNPFTATHGFAPPGPLDRPGAMVFQSAFLHAAEGITDYQYLLTLEQRLRQAEAANPHAEVVKEVRAFLEAVRRAIPAIPGSKNLLTPADGPLVGMGLTDEAKRFPPQWRRAVAGFLVRLGKG